MDISSSEMNSDISSVAPDGTNEAPSRVIWRLIWVAAFTLALWLVVLTYLVCHIPQIAQITQARVDTTFAGPGLHMPDVPKAEIVKLAGLILSLPILGMSLLQLLAPSTVISRRLISNTLFSTLLFSICASATIVSHLVPELGMKLIKGALDIAFQPQFLSANIFVIILIGTIIYRWRGQPMFDVTEIYWNLGLSLLLLLSVALVLAVI